MTHKEKENLVALISTIFISVPYFAYVYSQYQSQTLSTPEELKFFATSILLLIPIRIVAQIVIYILFTIARAIVTRSDKLEPELVDERDTLIDLKGERVAHYSFLFGFLASIIALASNSSIGMFFGILLVTGFASELFGILTKIYYYNKGV
jgi:hypothetical protein